MRHLHCTWRRLQQRPPFPPNKSFCCRCRQWWPPIEAYPIQPLLLFSNPSAPLPVSLRAVPSSSLNPEPYHPPSICFIRQDYDDDEDLEEKSDEDTSESDPDIKLDIDPDYNYYLVLLSYSLSLSWSLSPSLPNLPKSWWKQKRQGLVRQLHRIQFLCTDVIASATNPHHLPLLITNPNHLLNKSNLLRSAPFLPPVLTPALPSPCATTACPLKIVWVLGAAKPPLTPLPPPHNTPPR